MIKIITHNDLHFFYQYLKENKDVNLVVNYLKNNNTTIQIKKFDSDRDGGGLNVYLDNIDLSINGYCFNGKILIEHVLNFKKYNKIKQSEDFLRYITDYEKYNDVFLYFKLQNEYNRILLKENKKK